MKKCLLLLAGLLIGKAHAQDVVATRYTRYDQVPLQDAPGNGQMPIALLSSGDSVQVLLSQPVVAHMTKATMQQYVFVSHASEQGWVMRTALVGSRDSVAAKSPATLTAQPASSAGSYVPVTEAKRPYSAGGNTVRVTGTGARKPNYATPRTSSARNYYTGPRGGCYYLNSSGNKVYVAHSFCQ